MDRRSAGRSCPRSVAPPSRPAAPCLAWFGLLNGRRSCSHAPPLSHHHPHSHRASSTLLPFSLLSESVSALVQTARSLREPASGRLGNTRVQLYHFTGFRRGVPPTVSPLVRRRIGPTSTSTRPKLIPWVLLSFKRSKSLLPSFTKGARLVATGFSPFSPHSLAFCLFQSCRRKPCLPETLSLRYCNPKTPETLVLSGLAQSISPASQK